MAVSVTALLTSLERSLGQRGFDLLRPFAVKELNDQAPLGAALPLLGQEDALGVLVGNSRALWEPFLQSLPAEAELAPSPLDSYVESSCRAALLELDAALNQELGKAWLGFAHQLEPAPLPMQKLADACGLARLGPAHLNVHPRFGPWIALRAVLVFALPPPTALPPPAASPCQGCPAPCRDALAAALTPGPLDDRPEAPTTLSHAQARFLRVRDVCPIGRAERYSDAQIAYHYAKDRRALYPKG